MSEPTSTKNALLGELESIKGLLDDDIDPDQIPTLLDDIPLLENTLESSQDEANTETATEELKNSAAPQDDKVINGVLPGQQALFDEPVFDLAEHNSLSTGKEDREEERETLSANTAMDTPPAEEQLEVEDTENLEDKLLEDSLKQAYAGIYNTTTEDDENKPEARQVGAQPPITEAKEAIATAEEAGKTDAATSNEEDSTEDPTENLSEPAAETTTDTPAYGSAAIREYAPHLSGLASSPIKTSDTKQDSKPAPNSHSTSTLRGENPFLPKHIRDRLHTQKSLPDIIRDESVQWRPNSVSKSATAAIVDNLIAEYMPKIESELRQRLTLILEGKNQTAVSPEKPDRGEPK